jgi:uncharacterized protein YcbK (DUF882 family)
MSNYFSAKELNCRCGCGMVCQPVLISMLNQLREAWGLPLTLNSAARCEKHNKEVGGEPGSQHLKGRAADINTTNLNPKEVRNLAKMAQTLGFRGIGIGKSFLHVDCRVGSPAIWAYDDNNKPIPYK